MLSAAHDLSRRERRVETTTDEAAEEDNILNKKEGSRVPKMLSRYMVIMIIVHLIV
jgi:hypothetical protein